MLPSFTIPLNNSNNHWVPVSPVAYIISATNPVNPGALCLFIFFSAALTSLVMMGHVVVFGTALAPLTVPGYWSLQMTKLSHIVYEAGIQACNLCGWPGEKYS